MNASDSAKHTPGPWALTTQFDYAFEVQHCELTPVFVGTQSPLRAVAKLAWFGMTTEEFKANARLIASAPELLEFAALVARMRTLEEFGDGDDAPQQDDWIETLGELIASARVVVAKAQGGVT